MGIGNKITTCSLGAYLSDHLEMGLIKCFEASEMAGEQLGCKWEVLLAINDMVRTKVNIQN